MKISLLLFFLTISLSIYPQPSERIQVFTSGNEGHKSYRIPAIILLPGGDLLAFCEGRVHDAGDFGDINIVMKRSKDDGKTWSDLQTIVDYKSLQAGNPAPVVDVDDPTFPQGRIFLFYNTGNNHENEVRKGNGLREVWYKASADGGQTWSEPINITTQVHRPKQPQVNPDYNFNEDWRSYANTPGHAMQFSSGKYKGRIFVAANHSEGDPREKFTDYRAHGFYSDDHGKTFKLSENIAEPGSNEAMAVQLSNNRLMMNIRNQRGDIRARLIAISSDGGQRWDTTYFDKNLPDPVCQGSILALGNRNDMLAFCNPSDTIHRNNLTLRISFDEGKTWKKNWLIDKSQPGQEMSHAAYSDLVQINKKTIGILYERNNYKEIVFVKQAWR
jgi:sialidase-1